MVIGRHEKMRRVLEYLKQNPEIEEYIPVLPVDTASLNDWQVDYVEDYWMGKGLASHKESMIGGKTIIRFCLPTSIGYLKEKRLW